MENNNVFVKLSQIFDLCEKDEDVKIYVVDYLSKYDTPENVFVKYGKDNIGKLKSTSIINIGKVIGLLKGDDELLKYIKQMYTPESNQFKEDPSTQDESKDEVIISIDKKEKSSKVCAIISTFPKKEDIRTVSDIMTNYSKITKAEDVSDNIFYLIEKGHDYPKEFSGDYKLGICLTQATKTYIAGSYALKKFIDFIRSKKVFNLPVENFKNNDIDVFILDSPKDFHYKIDVVDMVFSTKSTVEELLLGFDLPVNRVAIDKDDNFVISAQCLKAVLTGKYYLPVEMKSEHEFININGRIYSSVNAADCVLL